MNITLFSHKSSPFSNRSELNGILGQIASAYGISRSPVKRFADLRRYVVGFLLAYEHALDVPDYYNEAVAYVQNMVSIRGIRAFF